MEGCKLEAHPRVGNRMLVPALLKPPHLMSFLGWPVAQCQLGHRCLKADQESLPPHHGARVSLHHSLGKGGRCVCVKYSSSPLGEGKGGFRHNYIQRTILPPAMGPWTGDARPSRPGMWQSKSGIWGGKNRRKSPS